MRKARGDLTTSISRKLVFVILTKTSSKTIQVIKNQKMEGGVM